MSRLRKFFSPIRLIAIVLLGLLLTVRIIDPRPVQIVRLQGFDLMQQIKPREYTKQPIAIVDLDEASFRKYGQWPWPRTRIAELIDGLAKRGAIVTGFDIIFSEYDRLSPSKVAADNPLIADNIREALESLPDNELMMVEAMKRHRVVLGQTSVRNERDANLSGSSIEDAGHAVIGNDPKQFLFNSPDIVQNVSELEAVASGRGVFSVDPDPDGIFRRVPLVNMLRGKIRLSLSTEILRVATGGNSFAIKSNAAGIEGVVVGNNFIESDRSGKVWPHFAQSRPSRYISAASILDGSVNPAELNGHMVLIGTSAVGLEDYRPTPLGQMPGVEVHAQVLENILTNSMLKRPATITLIEVLVAFAFGIVVIIAVPMLGALSSFAIAFFMMSASVATSWWYFDSQRFLLDASFPIAAIFLLFLFLMAANYLREEKQKGQIRSTFGQYVSPALVDELSEAPDKLKLGGEMRELSILFSDVRGFTTISESFIENPEGLTSLMNRFLNVMSEPILNNNGTIDKYMGDAVMAFWNAPMEEKQHARKACLTALEMIENVSRLNEARRQELEGKDGEVFHSIEIGVGINSGNCIVGNMGSDRRFDYTALGDAVNLASRLEGQSRPYGFPIVVGSATANHINNELGIFEIDLIQVKGKNEAVKIFALVGDGEFAAREEYVAFRALNATMLSAYRNQDWKSAYEALEKIEELGEKLNIPMETYIFIYETRISEFRANPPGRNWDGVYTATNK